MNDQFVSISFPDLSPAEASQLAAEFEEELRRAGANADEVRRERASADGQDLGSILILASSVAGPYLLELAKHAGKEFVGGAANESGKIIARKVMGYLLKKWNTRASIACSGQPLVIVGEARTNREPASPLPRGTRLRDLKTLGVVLVGASQFPNYPAEISNKAFARSAQLARQSFETRTIFRDVFVEDMFDQDVDPLAIVDRIEMFAAAHADMQDLIFYYCGHGEFLPERLGRSYYLLLKGTRPATAHRTALVLNEFTYMMDSRPALRDRRFYMILDSCFAGAAVDAFQGGAEAAVGQQIDAYVPPKGWALLAASDKKHPAIGADGAGATMFMGGVADVLVGKAMGTTPRLSLSDLAEAIRHYLAKKHPNEAVLPQCHSPRQADGDISRMPIFWTGTIMPIRIEKSAEAQLSALELEARRIWPTVEQSSVISVLDDFRRKYARTPYASFADARIADVQRLEVERKKREDAARAGERSAKVGGAPLFLGLNAHSPVELGQELTKDPEHWKAARDWWRTRASDVHQWVLHDLGYHDVADRLDALTRVSGSADGLLFRAHRALAPNEPARFLGRPLTMDEVKRLTTSARANDTAAREALRIILDDDLLIDVDGPSGLVSALGARWRAELAKCEAIMTTKGPSGELSRSTDYAIAILESLLDDAALTKLRRRAIAVSAELASQVKWYGRLSDVRVASAGQLIGIIEMAPVAAAEFRLLVHKRQQEALVEGRGRMAAGLPSAATWQMRQASAGSSRVAATVVAAVIFALLAYLVWHGGP